MKKNITCLIIDDNEFIAKTLYDQLQENHSNIDVTGIAKNGKEGLELIAELKPDLIFHLASNADVKLSFQQPLKIVKNNVNITINLLEAIRELKINPLTFGNADNTPQSLIIVLICAGLMYRL